MQDSVAVVFVALGRSTPLTLIAAAHHAADAHPQAKLFLVTDKPRRWSKVFPGEVVAYGRKNRNPAMRDLEAKFPRRALSADGYWIKTIERLFALEALQGLVAEDSSVIHYESDVLGFVGQDLLTEMKRRCFRVAVPLESLEAGCASIVFSPNLGALRAGLRSLEEVLFRSDVWVSDMGLLAAAASEGKIDVLPTRPEGSWEVKIAGNQRKYLFDATALGMYLFGRDGYHDGGEVTSGFRHPDFEYDLREWKWRLEKSYLDGESKSKIVVAEYGGEDYYIANLHVHSKIMPGPCVKENPQWMRIIEEANGSAGRKMFSAPNRYNFGFSLTLETFVLAAKIACRLFIRRVQQQSWRI